MSDAIAVYAGKGIFIRRIGDDRHYGHVEVRLSFPEGLRQHLVEFVLPNEEIQRKDWPSIEAAAMRWLEARCNYFGGKKALIQIFDGSWAGDAKFSAHAQATHFALEDAAKTAGILPSEKKA